MTQSSYNTSQAAGGIKDTIESILIAFILAFVFRAFVVEAFVIPTGSMAPTLLGANMRFRCEDCGYEFTVNYQGRNDGDDVIIPHTAGPMQDRVVQCPNCGFRLHTDQTYDPPVHYGDRILVLKYLYLFQQPQRWDVVVFKNPNDYTHQYTTNFIKRLIGRPGESVVVVDGDVYTGPYDARRPEDFQIQSKPRYAQEALWRVVYDNDFYPRQLQRVGRAWKQPWTAADDAGGWNLGSDAFTGRVFHFDNLAGSSAIAFDPKANPSGYALTDWLSYDQLESHVYPSNPDAIENKVSDLKLSFVYTRVAGDGPLRFSLSKLDTTFTAEFTPTSARLLKKTGDGAEIEIGKSNLSAPAGQPLRIEFTNVDYKVTLRVDDKNLIVTAPSDYSPNLGQLLKDFDAGISHPKPTIRIEPSGQRSTFAHIGLWRDVFYTNTTNMGSLQWGIPRDFPDHVVHLSNEKGKEEYFVMGDNSAISGDARYWNLKVDLPAEELYVAPGRVPARFMLGKAFFVYWPAGFRPLPSFAGLVPNFGQMRFIH